MQSDLYTDVAASVAAGLAGVGLFYARASALTARDATATAQRAVEVTLVSRRSAERARLRHRVQRVGELVHELYFSSLVDPGVDGLSLRTRAQCNILRQGVIGLNDTLPKSAAVCLAESPDELRERSDNACVEIDRVLAGLVKRRPTYHHRRTYRSRYTRRAQWHR